MISGDLLGGAYWPPTFYSMTYRLACSMRMNTLVDVGSRVLTLGVLLDLMTMVKPADSMNATGNVMNKFLSSPSDQPASCRSALSWNIFSDQVFSPLILALAYRYEVMWQLLRACMRCYCIYCGTALSHATAPSAR